MWETRKRWLPLVVGLMLFAFALYRFDSILALVGSFFTIISPFIIGSMLALMINIPMKALDRALSFMDRMPALIKARRALSLTLSVLIVLAITTLLLVVIIPQIITAIDQLIRLIPGLLRDLESWLSQQNENIRDALGVVRTDEGEVRDLFQGAYNILLGGLSHSSGVVISAAGYLVNLVISLVFAIYLLFSKERIKEHLHRFLRALLPQKAEGWVSRVISILVRNYSNFISGQVLIALISSGLSVLVLLVFGFPYAVLIGLITFVAAFIPLFGPFISGLLGVLLVLTVNPAQAPWFLLVYFVVQQLSGSVIYPRIMANAIDLPSIWVLVGVTVGGGIMGITGMFFFIPLVAAAYQLLKEQIKAREAQALAQEGSGFD